MLTIDRSTITDGGMTLLNSGNPINITSIKTGSGTYTSSEDIVSRTTLKSQMYSYTPSTVQVDGSSRTVSGLLSNYDPDTDTAIVTSDYTITEVGLFATVNGSDVLFAIGISYDGTEVPAFTGQNKSEIVVEWAMGLSGTDSVTVAATGAPALATDLNTHIGNGVYSASGVHGIRAVDDNGKKKLQVDDNGWKDIENGQQIQVTSLPTASADELSKVYQYLGSTTSSYTHGYFYECTENGGVYSWENIPVQDDESGTTIVTPPTVVVGTYTYNGSPQGPTITWATGMSDYCVVTNATQTDAGSYQLTIALKNTAKMVWNDGASGLSTADKIYNYSIAKANQTITLSSDSVTLDPNNLTATVTVSGAQGAISATTSDNTIATASVSDFTVTITGTSGNDGSATITVTAAATSNYNSSSATISVTAYYYPDKSFSAATDAELVEEVQLADEGKIDLYDDCGWRVGQERTVNLSAISNSGTYEGTNWNVGETQPAQTITLILAHRGGIELVTPVKDKNNNTRNTCSFVICIKDCLQNKGYMANLSTYSTWKDATPYRRGWCNDGFKNALPSSIRSIFKKFKCITGYNDMSDAGSTTGGTNIVTQDYFALLAEREIFSSWNSIYGSTTNEFNALIQFDLYKTTSYIMKKVDGVVSSYFERSPNFERNDRVCRTSNAGNTQDRGGITGLFGISPFGCV